MDEFYEFFCRVAYQAFAHHAGFTQQQLWWKIDALLTRCASFYLIPKPFTLMPHKQ
jgi:hypothetical protein